MRIYISSMAHPKRLAKRLAKEAGIPLNRAQIACAVMFGYKDWHELEQVTGAQTSAPSKPDWLLPTEIRNTRRNAFGVRLQRVLNFETYGDWTPIWSLIDELDPTGTIPDEEAFCNPLINDIFPVSWTLTEKAMEFFDEMPSVSMRVSVGQAGSREFENLLKQGVIRSKCPQPNVFIPEDRFGYRTFIVDFENRKKYSDIKPEAPGVALLPIRFIPTISEGVLLELELSIHPGAMASYHLDDEDTALIANSIIAYLRESNIWALSTGTVCGATNGILITLSGQVAKAPISRIMEDLKNELNLHNDAFDPDEEFDSEMQIFLPIRDFVDELEFDVPEEEGKHDFLVQHGHELVQGLVRETVALSKLPLMLEQILSANGFSQYAEFCNGMSMASLAERKKLSAFLCSMERAKALPRPVSIFFRHHLVDLMIGEYERSRSITAKDVGSESSLVDTATIATMARSLGDEELAVLIERNYDEVISAIRDAADDIDDLIEIFSQT